MLHAVLNKSWEQHPTKQQLYGHLPPNLQTILVRQARHAEHCWRSKDELINNILLWAPTHRHTCVGWPAKTCIHQLCVQHWMSSLPTTVSRTFSLLESLCVSNGLHFSISKNLMTDHCSNPEHSDLSPF